MSLGKWVSLLYRYGQIYMSIELKPYNIGKGQFLFLLALYQKDGLTQDELVEFINIDKGTTARAISKLEQNGYVSRRPNQQDQRSNKIFLTQQAIELKPYIYSILQKWTKILSADMTEEEVAKIFSLLAKMAHNATDYIQKNRE